MSVKRRKRPSTATFAADRAFLKKLKNTTDYTPTDPPLSIEALDTAEKRLWEAQQTLAHSARAYAHARAATTATKIALLNIIFGGASIVIELCDDTPDIAQVFGQKKRRDPLQSLYLRTTLSA